MERLRGTKIKGKRRDTVNCDGCIKVASYESLSGRTPQHPTSHSEKVLTSIVLWPSPTPTIVNSGKIQGLVLYIPEQEVQQGLVPFFPPHSLPFTLIHSFPSILPPYFHLPFHSPSFHPPSLPPPTPPPSTLPRPQSIHTLTA